MTATVNPTGREIVEKYKQEIREAVIRAVRSTKSCVLFYRDIYDELEKLFDDREVFRQVENALWESLDGLRLGDFTIHKIYVDADESFNEVVVVDFGNRLNDRQLDILREVASLFNTEFYDRYSEAEYMFYDATPLFNRDRYEIYTTLHNLARMWLGCDWLFDDEGDEEES